MAKDDHSSAAADRDNARMVREAHTQSRLAHAPRLAAPVSARAAMNEEEEGDPAPLTTPPTTTASIAPPAVPTNGVAAVRNILSSIEMAGDDFYTYLTPEERAYVRRATCPPTAAVERALQDHPASSLLLASSLLAVALGMLAGSLVAPATTGFRGVGMATTAGGAVVADRMLRYA